MGSVGPVTEDALKCDLLDLGCTAVADLRHIAEYPAADNKMEILRRERQAEPVRHVTFWPPAASC